MKQSPSRPGLGRRALLVAVVVAGLAVGVLPQQAFAVSNGSVDATGSDSVTGSPTDTTGGSTVDWVNGYSNLSGGTAAAVMTDPVGPEQTYVPGSLQVPPGWTPQWSTDGSTFAGAEPPAGVTTVRASNPEVDDPSTSSGADMPRPILSSLGVNSDTGGDGFRPIPYGDRIFNIYHHAGQFGSSPEQINCTVRATGNHCPGYPDTLSGKSTSNWPHEHINMTAAGAQMWFPIQRANDAGVQCYNLDTNAACGYVQLSTLDAPNDSVAGVFPTYIEGVHEIGGNLYAVSPEGVHCMELATETPCAGQPYAVGPGINWSIPNHVVGTNDNGINWGTEAIDGRLYFTVNYASAAATPAEAAKGGRFGCFDPATNSTCAGWSGGKFLTNSDSWHVGLQSGAQPIFPRVTPAGVTNGVCTVNWNSLNAAGPPAAPWHFLECYRLDGTAMADPPNFDLGPANNRQWINAMVYGDRLFLAGHGNTTSAGQGGVGICYDYSAQDMCAGWGTTGAGRTAWPTINSGDPVDYAYASDGPCLLALGHEGNLWSFDPQTGDTPCRTAQANVTVNPADYYCSDTGSVNGWSEVRLAGAGSSLSGITVTVRDANGDPVPGFDGVPLPAGGSLDISSIPYSGTTTALSVTVDGTAGDTAAWAGGNAPRAQIVWDGTPVEMCLQTILDICPTITAVTNTVTAVTDDGTGPQTATDEASLNVTLPDECQPPQIDLELDKQVDAGNGFEPADTADAAAPVQVDTPFTYRLTVLNNGPDAATGVTVNDPVPAGLVFQSGTGDGTFDPATGVWIIGDIAVGQTVTMDITAVLPLANLDQFASDPVRVNRAEVCAADQEDTDSTPCNDGNEDDDDPAVVTLIQPDVTVVKDDGIDVVTPGQDTTYDVTVTNNGPGNAAGVVAVDTLPTNTTFVEASDGGVFDETAGTVTWPAADLAAGATVTYTVTVNVNDDVAPNDEVTNNVCVTAVADSNPDNNCDDDTDIPEPPDVTVVKDDGIDVVTPGQDTTYDVTVTNNGPGNAAGVVAVDTLPTNTTFVEASDGGVFDETAGTVTWPATDLAAGATVTYTVTVNVNDDVAPNDEVTNNVCVTADRDSNPDNNCDDDTDTVPENPPPPPPAPENPPFSPLAFTGDWTGRILMLAGAAGALGFVGLNARRRRVT